MSEESVETEYHEDYNLPSEPSPARPLSPLTFFGPSADPAGEMDLRPAAIPLSDKDLEQEVPREDGHGNFKSGENRPEPVHPSQKRTPQPYERTNVANDEESEEPTEE